MEPRPLKTMIKSCLLKAICRYELKIDEAEVKASDLHNWMKTQVDLDRTYGADMVKEMKKLQMKVEGTPLGRVLYLTGDFMEIVTKNGWEDSFKGREGRKLEVKFLLEAVRPFKLREKMKKLVNVAETALQKSPELFLERLKEKVRSHQEWEDFEDQPVKKKRGDSNHKKNESRKRSSTDVRGARPSDGKKPKIDHARGKNLECFHCGEKGHPVYACPENLSKEKIAQILKERNKSGNNKQKQKKDYLLVCRLDRYERNTCGRILAKINEGNYVSAILDSGTAEVCLIPKQIAEDAIRSNDLRIEALDPPVKLRLGDNETEIEATEAITVVIRLKTKVGELITRKHRCLIWDVPSDEIILGGDFLKQLGIDPESALETLIIENQSECTGFTEDTAGGIEDPKTEASTDLSAKNTQVFEKYDDIVIGEKSSQKTFKTALKS
jgi:hypothetical protein